MLEASDLKDSKCRVEYGPGFKSHASSIIDWFLPQSVKQEAALLDRQQNTEFTEVAFRFIMLLPKSKGLKRRIQTGHLRKNR